MAVPKPCCSPRVGVTIINEICLILALNVFEGVDSSISGFWGESVFSRVGKSWLAPANAS